MRKLWSMSTSSFNQTFQGFGVPVFGVIYGATHLAFTLTILILRPQLIPPFEHFWITALSPPSNILSILSRIVDRFSRRLSTAPNLRAPAGGFGSPRHP